MNNIITNETTTLSENKKKSPKTKIAIVAIALALAATVATLLFVFLTPPQKTDEEKYNEAKTFLAEGDYNNAYLLFRETVDYADSADYLKDFRVEIGEKTTDSKTGKTTKVYKRNEDGKLIEVQHINNGKESSKELYTYDEKGNMTSHIAGLASYKTEYIYDENDNITKKTEYSDDSFLFSTEYIYDNNNELIREIYSDEKSTITSEYSNGLVIKRIYNSPLTEEVNHESKYFYDNSGNILTVTDRIEGGTEYVQEKTTYNENGKILTYHFYDLYGNDMICDEYKYSDDGKIKEKQSTDKEFKAYDEGYDINNRTFYYDEKERIIRELDTRSDSLGDFKIYREKEYTYDNVGNMIKQVEKRWSDNESPEDADISTATFTYDGYGNTLTYKLNSYDGEVHFTRYEYNKIKVIYDPKTEV